MNKNILKISTLVAIWAFCSQNATAQQGFGTNQPSKASVIEMKSGTKGLLIPRVALTGLNNFDPIKGELGTDAAKVNSLLVYNTATTTGITPGYYYWTTDGTTPNSYWKRLLAGDDAAALNLLGDVTGTLGATTVVKIQGRDVANAAPNTNQVLTWNGSAWTPTTLTPAQITNKATLSVQDGIAITAGSGADVLLGAATIGISNGGIAPVKIQPAAELTTRMVMVTQTDGTVTWIPQTDIAPTTTNALSSADNSMTSNVNEVSSSASIINTNALSLNTGNHLVSTVNGIPSSALDLSAAVQAGETLTSITQDATSGVITYKRERDADQTANVVSATSDNLISYDAGAFLNATTIQNNQLNTVVAQGTGITVTPSTSGNTTTYTVAANPVDAADLTNKGTLSVSGGLEFTGSSNGTDKLLANAGIGVANGGIDNVKLANNAVSAIKIEDGAVTASKVNANVAGTGLTKNTTTGALDVDMAAVETELADGTISSTTNGAITVTNGTNSTFKDVTLAVKAVSGVEVHDDNVKLGGDLTRVTTITADATNTLAIAGLQPTTDAAKTTDAFVVVGDNGVLKKADIKYSTTEQVTGKKWIGGQVVYERVLEVTLSVEANTITLPLPTGSRPAKIIGMRMISRTDNSITTELSRYNATTGDMVFGSGPTTQFQKVGTYDLILEYIK